MTSSHSAPSDRETLSALFDGELGGDVARFALKRLDHDRDWRSACERWSLVGDVLRAQGHALPAPLPSRARTVAVAGTAPRSDRTAPRWWRWGGAGLAASAAAVALLVARTGPALDAAPAAAPAARVVAAGVPPGARAAIPAPVQPRPAPAPAGQDAVQLAGAGLAVAGASREGLARQRRAQPRVASATGPTRSQAVAAAARAVAASPPAAMPAAAPSLPNPFVSTPAARPWPRAVLPQFQGNAAVTTDFASQRAPSFYPFEPRLPDPADDLSEADGGSGP